MKILRAYKVELNPNKKQRTAMLKHCGAARFVYNWGLAQNIEAYKAGEKILGYQKLDSILCSIKADEFPWLSEVSSYCRQGALSNLDRAYKNFFDRCKKGKTGKAMGFPKFKSRKKGLGSFTVFGYTVTENAVRLARIGVVRLKENNYLPLGGYGKNTENIRFYGGRVTERAGRWYFSVQVEEEIPEIGCVDKPVVGVDFGIKTLATCSDGTEFKNPKALKANIRKLKRLQRAMSRKMEAAKRDKRPLRECRNFQKNKAQVARLHAHIADLRSQTLHHVSHVVTRKSSCVVIEDLNVQGMMKNRHLAQALGDCGFYELRRQIEYKAAWRGVDVLVANRWFASSKTCNICGVVNTALNLLHRRWTCSCGVTHERDVNAAINLQKLAGNRSDNSNACGCESSGSQRIVSETIADEAGSEPVTARCGTSVSYSLRTGTLLK